MKCLLTGQEGKGVKAHIIPKSFYHLDDSQKVPLEVLTNSKDGYNGVSFVGIYDATIVTENGERIFSPWDTYAHDLLIAGRNTLHERKSNGDTIALEAAEYDYAKLKLFILSVLWRASASARAFFRRITLGPHEPIIRRALLDADPGDENFYSVTLACFIDLPAKTAMLDPHCERYDGISYYRFFLGGYIAYIKVDKRPAPQELAPSVLKPNFPLTIICREFHKSKEKVVVRKLVLDSGS